jgi:hypothetical protein
MEINILENSPDISKYNEDYSENINNIHIISNEKEEDKCKYIFIII